ncbi:probable ATP-dependent RNA helicase ddx20 [Mercenaria mercenaria]|uniref:probable ATP-dependent RNA helicase ddx20 n=1 Tax=Mercenaria mercenaria TaxID=6596 RepID=UPI00234E71F2|nr:probable ATP-dependent RNA helicase ddx20 [Mercenaria mercenaria]
MSKVAHNLQDKARTGDIQITESVDFGSLLLSDNVLKGLKNSGFVRPSPIQLKAIPLGRCGLDLIVQAKSGTGKTCVFSVIALESTVTDTVSTQVLVLAPTREIAVQIWEVINSIGSAIKELECQTFIGGLPLQEDRIKLKKCHIAVGTPGRIKQLIEGGVLKTDSLRLFILDEADKLLEESFQEQINWIYSTLPENKQMLALSATYPEYLAEHLTAYMRNPTFLRLNISDPALLGIRQYYQTVAYHPLSHVIFEEKCKVLSNILSSVSFQQCLVFSNLQTRAQTLADSLTSRGWPTACIAGCLDQKERNHAMAKLKTYKCRILISTDLTSRGIDADKVNMVINLDVPTDHETYLHRIGRAGRFGSFGIAISLVSDGQERMNLDVIEKRCNTQIYSLPDPLPSDLAKPDSPIFLDDVVSSEVIHTEKTPSGQVGPLKEKLASSSRSAGSYSDTSAGIKDRNGFTDVVNTGNANVFESKINKGNLGDTKVSLNDIKDKNENDSKKFVNGNSNDGLMRHQVETRTSVGYEGVEYYEMSENSELNLGEIRDTCKDKKLRNTPTEKNSNGNLGVSGADCKPVDKVYTLSAVDSKGGKDGGLTVEGNMPNAELEEEVSSDMNVPIDKMNIPNKLENNMMHNVQSSGVHSLKNCKLSTLNFEKVNICNVYKNSIGFKRLPKHHSYSTARESLKMFRENLDTDKETVDNKTDLSIPEVQSDNTESEMLQHAIAQLQDLLENRQSVYSTETSSEVEVPKALGVKVNEVDIISSEDEFEAKEEMLNRKKNASPIPNINVAEDLEQKGFDNQKPDEFEGSLILEEKSKEKVKKTFQKARKQRFGYQGNFAIGHLLQQEREQKLETENPANEGLDLGAGDVVELGTKKSESVKTLAMQSSEQEGVPNNIETMVGAMPDRFQDLSIYSRNISKSNLPECQTQKDFCKASLPSMVNEQKSTSSFPCRTDADKKVHSEKVGEHKVGEDSYRETDSSSVSSTTDSESSEEDLGALPKIYKKTREYADRDTKQADITKNDRFTCRTRIDSRSDDSGVCSRPLYQEQWRQWYEQYENWHQQSMNMWGYTGIQNNIQDLNSEANTPDYGYSGYSGWQYPAHSVYYPYQNYHQSYPFDNLRYNRPYYQPQTSSNSTEEMASTFQFQEEYIKEMSKCRSKKKMKK